MHLMLRATRQLPPEEAEAEEGDGGALLGNQSEAGLRGIREGHSLPPPMLPGNWAPVGSGCFLRDALKGVVAESKGFEAMEVAEGTKAEVVGSGGSGQRREGSGAAWGFAASMDKGEEASAELAFGPEAVPPQRGEDALPEVVAGEQVSVCLLRHTPHASVPDLDLDLDLNPPHPPMPAGGWRERYSCIGLLVQGQHPSQCVLLRR